LDVAVDSLLGMAVGLFLAAFAATEFQGVQFLPAFVLPQFLLCVFLVRGTGYPSVLQWILNVLPLSYAVDAHADHHHRPGRTAAVLGDVAIVLGFVVGLIAHWVRRPRVAALRDGETRWPGPSVTARTAPRMMTAGQCSGPGSRRIWQPPG